MELLQPATMADTNQFCTCCLWKQKELRVEEKTKETMAKSRYFGHRCEDVRQKNSYSHRTCHCISMLRQVTSDLNSLPSGHSARRRLYSCLILCLIVWAASIIPISQATPIFNQPATLRPGSHNPSSSATKTKNNTSISERIFASKPSWHDPCGLKHQKDLHHSKNAPFLKAIQKPNDDDLMHGIVNMAKMALRQSRFFKEDYVKKTFHEPSWWDHHERWKDMRYRWLPTWEEVPKHLHENALLSHYEELEMMSALQNTFTYLQKLAAGMEQVVIDQADHKGKFLMEFDTAQYALKTLLCEIEYAMLQKGMKEHELEEIPRDIMPENVRHLEDASYRNLRDWYIYRDYMNGLEYVVDAFNFLKNNNRRRRRRRRQSEWIRFN